MTRALFLGRFQPLHLGHLKIIRQALKEVDELIIVIGSAQESHTAENPFSADERTEMIEKTLREEKIENCQIIPVEDINDDDRYVTHVEAIVPEFDKVYAAENPVTAKLFSQQGYPVWTCKRIAPYESTKVRTLMRKADQQWKKLVPPAAVKIIQAIEGEKRIQGITEPR
ncbi:MAG TPA: nicotinamide-nucleotide adenylyltransferase [Candidatus Nanoarchaeia archaeon]|nr:nicotinamide-nucleotide adenylyltransferase [Candidatus Nanoarchaeia archaeon]